MNLSPVPWYRTQGTYFLLHHSTVVVVVLLISSSATALAQNASQPTNLTKPFSIRATHLLGFESATSNANGTLSIQDEVLQFQKSGKPAVQVKITSVQDVFLGEETRQVGGTAMTLGKAAAPFGGGRAVSLFAHKKYDTLGLEYVDASGAIHGAIFQLEKGQGQAFKNELVTKGVHSNAEVPNESK